MKSDTDGAEKVAPAVVSLGSWELDRSRLLSRRVVLYAVSPAEAVSLLIGAIATL